MSLLEGHGIHVSFGGVRALAGVNLALHDAEILGLIGPNGSGKTTLLNVISGFLRPQRGRVMLSGAHVRPGRPERAVRQGLTRTFQNSHPIAGMSVLENVLIGFHSACRYRLRDFLLRPLRVMREERRLRDQAIEMLEAIGIAAFADERAGDVPYGIQRLADFARAALVRPRVLLLDEPFAGLAAGEWDNLLRCMTLARDRGTAIVLVEHNMRIIMGACDRITVLNQGEIIANGSPAEVQRHPQVMKAYLGSE